eukprot:6197007-Pleurochrysis_carterae.AAC.2
MRARANTPRNHGERVRAGVGMCVHLRIQICMRAGVRQDVCKHRLICWYMCVQVRSPLFS